MSNLGKFSHSVEVGGKTITLETGVMAKQADGAVIARIGDTMVLATAVCDKVQKPGLQDFVPLTVNYKDGTFYVEGSGTSGKIYIYARYFSTYTVAYTTVASYQVTFDDATGDDKQDSNVTQVVVATGTKVGKPTDPERDGYDFDGWFISGTDTKWNFDTAVTSDITLVAHWDEEDDDDDDEVVVTPAPVVTTAPRSPKTSDALPGYAFWLILAAAGLAVGGMSAKGRRKEQE